MKREACVCKVIVRVVVSMCAVTKHVRHLERPHLLLLCVIGYKVIRWTLRELNRDLL